MLGFTIENQQQNNDYNDYNCISNCIFDLKYQSIKMKACYNCIIYQVGTKEGICQQDLRLLFFFNICVK